MQDPASATIGLEAIAWRFFSFIGPVGSAVLGTLVLLWKLGLLKRNGNGNGYTPLPEVRTGPVNLPPVAHTIADQLGKNTTGDWTVIGHMLKELGDVQEKVGKLEGELKLVKERGDKNEEAIAKLTTVVDRFVQSQKNLAPNTAKIVMLGLRKAGLIPDKPVFVGGEIPDEDKLKDIEL